jgi:hypothetical protein
MESSNAGTGAGREGKLRAGLMISLALNVVLAMMVAGLAIWGWEREALVLSATKERDEAWETSRNLQDGLIRARGELKGVNESMNPPTPAKDQDEPPP